MSCVTNKPCPDITTPKYNVTVNICIQKFKTTSSFKQGKENKAWNSVKYQYTCLRTNF